MKVALFSLLPLLGQSIASSVALGGASQSSCFYEKPSWDGSSDITDQSLWAAAQGSLCQLGKRAEETVQSPKSTSKGPNKMLQERTTSRLPPSLIPRRQGRDGRQSTSPHLGKTSNDRFRRSKSFPELATEALLKLEKITAYKQTRSLVTIDVLLPITSRALEKFKVWDTPIGRAAKAIDEVIASLQRKIGGEQVPEIHGNELKLRMICYVRGVMEHKNTVDEACGRLHGRDQEEAVAKESEVRSKLIDVFDHCDTEMEDEARPDLVKACKELSQQTVDLEEATQALITFRTELQAEIQAGGKLQQADLDRAEALIRKGGFGTPVPDKKDWAKELATWYLGDLVSEAKPKPGKSSQPDCDVLPEWATKPSVKARELPQDKIAGLEAYYIIVNGLYEGTFTANEVLTGEETCWSATGLRDSKPYNWDALSAALVYVNKSFGTWRVACKACESLRTLEWQLRCGSTKPLLTHHPT